MVERQSGLSELFVISWASAVEGCLLSGVPLYSKICITYIDLQPKRIMAKAATSHFGSYTTAASFAGPCSFFHTANDVKLRVDLGNKAKLNWAYEFVHTLIHTSSTLGGDRISWVSRQETVD